MRLATASTLCKLGAFALCVHNCVRANSAVSQTLSLFFLLVLSSNPCGYVLGLLDDNYVGSNSLNAILRAYWAIVAFMAVVALVADETLKALEDG